MSIRKLLTTVLAVVACTAALAYEPTVSDPVVIVSSYNPDVKSISDNLAAFTEEYSKSGCQNPVVLENMHCLNLSESLRWKNRMWNLLEKYYEDGKQPAAIVLLGTEASSCYFSIDRPELKETAVVFGMRGDNMIRLPESGEDLSQWQPETYYLTKDFDDFNIVGGLVYEYDIEKSLAILEQLHTKIDTLAFISDNTFGGVTMRSHFDRYMESNPKYAVKHLDGRMTTFPQLDQELANLKEGTAIVLGTWRIDKSDSYALKNTTHTLAYSNPSIPAISLASVGLGHWALGGYVPDYIIQGGLLADAVTDYLKTGKASEITKISSTYTIDHEVAARMDYPVNQVPKPCKFINKPVSFFRENMALIIITSLIIFILASCLALTGWLLKRSKKLQHSLEKRGEELAIERDRAEKASAMKSSFISNISHEIRTPLNAVVGFSQLLSNDTLGLEPEEKAEYGEHILMNSKVLLNLIDEVLDLSRMDADRIAYNIMENNLVDIANAAAEAARLDISPEVEVVVHSDAEKVMIETDKERIYQVFCNLLSNAKKFTEKGSITIDIETPQSKDYVIVKVSDTGSGIPEGKADAIFDRFVKLDPYKQGTGLGLSIVQSIVSHFGGNIKVDTAYKDGARFVFTHPYRQ
ncbi:MAG: HAMP domain-containing histidine kinase [Bacteroidales bacterium]|nr:HAMP domain-containing histidine kinase [Candidatus Cryptobacteroides caccocaballi]